MREEAVLDRGVWQRAVVGRLAPAHAGHVVVVTFRAAGGQRDDAERRELGGGARSGRPQPPPLGDHCWELAAVTVAGLAVAHRAAAVVLALIPQVPGHRRVHKRGHHAVVQAARWRLAVRVERLVLALAERGVGRPCLDLAAADGALDQPDRRAVALVHEPNGEVEARCRELAEQVVRRRQRALRVGRVVVDRLAGSGQVAPSASRVGRVLQRALRRGVRRHELLVLREKRGSAGASG